MIEGKASIIKHTLLPNKRLVLSLTSNRTLLLHDIFTCKLIESLVVSDALSLSKLKSFIEETEYITDVIPTWCVTDIYTGTIRITLEKSKCTDAEW